MKRKTIPLLALVISLLIPATANAQSIIPGSEFHPLFNLNVFETKKLDLVSPEKKPDTIKPKKVNPVVYVVTKGDNLTKIGTKHNVEWQRIWAKNKKLDHPDILQIGQKIIIPNKDEQLAREVPAAVQLPETTPGVVNQAPAAPPAATSYSAGNTYIYGYCTWYVKNRRGASLPNTLGNANTWYQRAAAAGMATGSTPRPGAVGATTRGALGHVVYVESVNGDGTIQISEMNSPIWGKTTYRTASASEFVYIY